jgi:hypothetical protein
MFFVIKSLILVALIVMIAVPNKETEIPKMGMSAPECLKSLKDVFLFFTVVVAIKWLYSAYRLRIYYRSRKNTA